MRSELANLLSKTHLQQAVSLVQHKRLQVLKPHRLGVPQMVDQPPLHPSRKQVRWSAW